MRQPGGKPSASGSSPQKACATDETQIATDEFNLCFIRVSSVATFSEVRVNRLLPDCPDTRCRMQNILSVFSHRPIKRTASRIYTFVSTRGRGCCQS